MLSFLPRKPLVPIKLKILLPVHIELKGARKRKAFIAQTGLEIREKGKALLNGLFLVRDNLFITTKLLAKLHVLLHNSGHLFGALCRCISKPLLPGGLSILGILFIMEIQIGILFLQALDLLLVYRCITLDHGVLCKFLRRLQVGRRFLERVPNGSQVTVGQTIH